MFDAGEPITGYLDRLSRRPGEVFTGYVSVADPGPCRARLCRILGDDLERSGSGIVTEDLRRIYDRRFTGLQQLVYAGSCGIAPSPARDPCAACSWTVLVWSAGPGSARAVLSEQDAHCSVVITVGCDGAAARLAWPGGGCWIATYKPMLPYRWHRVWLSADPASGRVRLGQIDFQDQPAAIAEAQLHGQTVSLPGGIPGLTGSVLIAAQHGTKPFGHFDGRLEAPAILEGFLVTWTGQEVPLASWDFSRGIETFAIEDVGPQGCHGHLVNAPTRGVVGSGWTGREMCWRYAPGDYGAIHFHSDDLDDCEWTKSFTWVVPRSLPSGAYAMHLTQDDHADDAAYQAWLPLYVLPPLQGPFSRVAFLAPTFTYQNHLASAARSTPAEPGAAGSGRHRDGSHVYLVSRRQPLAVVRAGSGHYADDARVLAWLAAAGLRYDVITDEDLDDAGSGLLAPYRCILTGVHPRDQTEAMLDAIGLYVGGGGRLAYVGGGGFSSRIARRLDLPHLIERRDGEPAEQNHQLDGQFGGLWRQSRRAPQRLVAVGWSGVVRSAGPFRRTNASYAPENAWVFAGVEEDVAIGPGEWVADCTDAALGTPEGAVVLARVGGGGMDAGQAEMTYFATPSGGAVFSAGTAGFCTALRSDGAFDTPASRLLENVIRRFIA